MMWSLNRGLQFSVQHLRPSCRLCSVAASRCWKCNTAGSNGFFCASCGVLLDVSQDNYFSLFQQKKGFTIDFVELTKTYRQIQSLIHPDKFGQRSAEEKTLALEWSALINKAYKTLSKPLDRGTYLLKLEGVTISEDNSSIDHSFLLQMMEFNESVEDAQSVEELQELEQEISNRTQKLNGELEQLFSVNDKEAAKLVIIRLKYLLNIESTIKEKVLRLSLKAP
ncbi:iron-sulfur cluster co-chaperone protein HscB [Anopheles cruzii]|uniref:iron-sulfur cluster co-chaperone protein HscB n=1 Tax=Anopheles cruzii TaxID=68878 RepID=UPI0022EC4328|nr:iron-sulfur cluster co-chaperone protein HscB [Anopheles cruzii]